MQKINFTSTALIKKVLLAHIGQYGSQALDFASASLPEKVHGARCRVFKW